MKIARVFPLGTPRARPPGETFDRDDGRRFPPGATRWRRRCRRCSTRSAPAPSRTNPSSTRARGVGISSRFDKTRHRVTLEDVTRWCAGSTTRWLKHLLENARRSSPTIRIRDAARSAGPVPRQGLAQGARQRTTVFVGCCCCVESRELGVSCRDSNDASRDLEDVTTRSTSTEARRVSLAAFPKHYIIYPARFC